MNIYDLLPHNKPIYFKILRDSSLMIYYMFVYIIFQYILIGYLWNIYEYQSIYALIKIIYKK